MALPSFTYFQQQQKGHNKRTLFVENNGNSAVEIMDIIIHFKDGNSCMTVEANMEDSIGSNEDDDLGMNKKSKGTCLGGSRRLIVQPQEQEKKIGILRLFPQSLESGSNQRIFEGRIELVTNSTEDKIEIQWRYFEHLQILNYTESVMQIRNGLSIDPLRDKKRFQITNQFSAQLKLTALVYPKIKEGDSFENHFLLSEQQETILEPGETNTIFNFVPISQLDSLHIYILLEFNKNFVIPVFIQIYNMKLSCALPNALSFKQCDKLANNTQISLGNRAINENAVQYITIKNYNPLPVHLQAIHKLNSPLNMHLLTHFDSQGDIKIFYISQLEYTQSTLSFLQEWERYSQLFKHILIQQ